MLTVSDGVSHGTRRDDTGEVLASLLEAAGFELVRREVVPDEVPRIVAAIEELLAEARLVVTNGGTGLGPRDVTPEATAQLVERDIPGLAEAMRAAGRAKTPLADLSRGMVGAVGTGLIVNTPGSPKGAKESLEAIVGTLPHVLDLLAGHTRHGDADAPRHPGHGDAPGRTHGGRGPASGPADGVV